MFEALLSLCVRLAALAVLLGWSLSLGGGLSARNYLLAGVPLTAAAVWSVVRNLPSARTGSPLRRWRNWWRHRRWLPLLYLFIFVLVVAGSVLHAPNNFDGLSYRAPRVLHWLDQGGWHWIHTRFEPMNYMMAGYEWMSAPFIALTHGLRTTVVINWLAFAFLPSLMFSLLRTFGARRRVAYDWMWLFPSGYVVTLLAGGIGNDLFGLVLILAALHFARRFTEKPAAPALFDSLLAAGLVTGVKLSNLPLPLFVFIVLAGAARPVWANFKTLIIGGLAALVVSGAITLGLNWQHTGTPLGASKGLDQTSSMLAGWTGNGLILASASVAPPIFPGSRAVMQRVEQSIPANGADWLRAHYPKFTLSLTELPQEEAGGLGLGITLALVVMFAGWWKHRATARPMDGGAGLCRWQRRAWFITLAFCLAAVLGGLGTGPAVPRNLLPWFPLCLAPLLAGLGREETIRSVWWRSVAGLAMASVIPALIFTPSRPLCPPSVVAGVGHALHLPAKVQDRLTVVYDTYARRADPFAAMRRQLPADQTPLGLITLGQEPATSWWQPFGQRHCEYLLSAEDLHAARQRGIQYFVLEQQACGLLLHAEMKDWISANHATVVGEYDISIYAAQAPWHYMLVKLER